MAGYRNVTRIDFPYLLPDRDRHGNERLYVRRHGRKIRIRAKPGTQAFAEAYAEALHALSQRHIADRPILKGAPAGTLGWLLVRYGGKTKAGMLGFWGVALSTALAAVLLFFASWMG